MQVFYFGGGPRKQEGTIEKTDRREKKKTNAELVIIVSDWDLIPGDPLRSCVEHASELSAQEVE